MTGDSDMNRQEDIHFRILRLLDQNPSASQRDIAVALGVSLGGVNYCLRALVAKGHVKIENFQAAKNKLRYVYVLTPEGIAHRAKLAARFIRRKMAEYEAIKAEIESLRLDYGDKVASTGDGGQDQPTPPTPSEPKDSWRNERS